jgi:ABC-2 type transport system permease protein
VYSIVKPLALTGILVVMFGTITKGDFGSPAFAAIYVGNAFYLYVGAVMSGTGYAVLDDRERYRTLKSLYVAPIDVPSYFVGRGAARFLTGTFSVIITLAIGVIFLRLPIRLTGIDWPMFAAAMGFGVVILAMLGLMLASVLLLLGQFSWGLGEAVAGSMFLMSGAVFPLEVLPRAARVAALLLPLPYWLELVRRALLGSHTAFETFQGRSSTALFGVLGVDTIAVILAAALVFRVCDYVARERGLIDQTTNY